MRIQGGLLKLGISVPATVATMLRASGLGDDGLERQWCPGRARRPRTAGPLGGS
jgi:hypothetical protein